MSSFGIPFFYFRKEDLLISGCKSTGSKVKRSTGYLGLE